MKKSITIILSVSLAAALFLVGCGKSEPPTVESIVNSDEQVSETINSASSGSGVEVSIKENTITYTYDIGSIEGVTDEMIENEAFLESIKSSVDSLTDPMVNVAKSIETETKVSGVVVKVLYNYNGKEIVSASFNSSGKIEE